MSDTYIIVERPALINSRWGGEVYRVKLENVDTKKTYTTYIDPNNKNYRNWHEIVTSEDKGWVLENIRVKNHKKGLVDADSVFVVINTVDRNELRDAWLEAI